MDKLKIKHNHKLTDILKVCIFSIVMMAPLFAIGTKCLYVICNKNAYQNYSSDYIEQVENITNPNNLVEKQTYYYDVEFTTSGSNIATYRYYYTDINVDWTDYGAIERTYYSFKIYRLGNNNNYYVWLYYDNTNHQQVTITNSNMPRIVFTYNGVDTTSSDAGIGGHLYTYILTTKKLDNVFYDAVEQLTEEPTFNWTTNTGVYTTINAMFTGLEMPNGNALAVMLTYWMICMLIYLVIDIIVALITKMTHLFNE